MGDGCTAVPAHKRVRRTCGKAKDQRDRVPGYGAKEAGEKNLFVHQLDVNHVFANGLGHRGAENEGGDEVPESRPYDGAKRRQNAGGDDRGDGIGGVMPAVREFEGEGEEDDKE